MHMYKLFYILLKLMYEMLNYRCQMWEKDMEIREMKDQIRELVGLLRQSEIKRKEVEKELKVRELDDATTLAKPVSVRSRLKIQKKINWLQ